MINGIVIQRGPFQSIWLRAGCVDKVTAPNAYEQALVCLSNREMVEVNTNP